MIKLPKFKPKRSNSLLKNPEDIPGIVRKLTECLPEVYQMIFNECVNAIDHTELDFSSTEIVIDNAIDETQINNEVLKRSLECQKNFLLEQLKWFGSSKPSEADALKRIIMKLHTKCGIQAYQVGQLITLFLLCKNYKEAYGVFASLLQTKFSELLNVLETKFPTSKGSSQENHLLSTVEKEGNLNSFFQILAEYTLSEKKEPYETKNQIKKIYPETDDRIYQMISILASGERSIDGADEACQSFEILVYMIRIAIGSENVNLEVKLKFGKIVYGYAVNKDRKDISLISAFPHIQKMYVDWVTETEEYFQSKDMLKNFWLSMTPDQFKKQLNGDANDLPKSADFVVHPSQKSETDLVSLSASEQNEWTRLI